MNNIANAAAMQGVKKVFEVDEDENEVDEVEVDEVEVDEVEFDDEDPFALVGAFGQAAGQVAIANATTDKSLARKKMERFVSKRAMQTVGLHYGRKLYTYLYMWKLSDLFEYSYRLGLLPNKGPEKATYAAIGCFALKQGVKQAVSQTVGSIPGTNTCINAVFSRFDRIKAIIEHLEKWNIPEDLLPMTNEEWRVFQKAHTAYLVEEMRRPDCPAWTTAEKDAFVKQLRLLHAKDMNFPWKVCALLRVGVAVSLPSVEDFKTNTTVRMCFFYLCRCDVCGHVGMWVLIIL
jgi:hypothetical protein